MMYQTNPYHPTGWRCPICGAINAPFVWQCPCGGNPTRQYQWRYYEQPQQDYPNYYTCDSGSMGSGDSDQN